MKILQETKQIIIMMISLSLICFGIGIFFANDQKSFFVGILFGTIFSVLKLILLEKTLARAMNMNGQKATNYIRIHYTLRYFLTFIALAVAISQRERIDIYGVIISMLLLRPAIYLVDMKNKMNKRIN